MMKSNGQNKSMRIYQVSKDEYFGNLEVYIRRFGLDAPYSYVESKELCKEPMNSLIRRYNLENKEVFSLGSSFGHEEYWFYKNGCNLTLLDIDESKIIENYLKTLSPSTGQNRLTYIIGDAFEYLREGHSECRFDVFYVSSFTPDELRRGDIQARNAKFLTRAINYLTYKTFRKRFLKTWPSATNPYMDLVMDLTEKNLKKDGLFISQSYACGVNVKSNPHFVKLAKNQLRSIGITLLRVYCFKSFPNVSLTIGLKGNSMDALDYLKEIEKNKEITTFHGRTPYSKLGCEIVYEHRGH